MHQTSISKFFICFMKNTGSIILDQYSKYLDMQPLNMYTNNHETYL